MKESEEMIVFPSSTASLKVYGIRSILGEDLVTTAAEGSDDSLQL